MWEIQVLKEKIIEPHWLKEKKVTELADGRAMDLFTRGYIKLLRHFRYVSVKKQCPKCKHTLHKRVKKYTEE